MPYIDPIRRALIDSVVTDLITSLRESPAVAEKRAGCLNYVVTRLLIAMYDKPSYADYNEALGVLEAAKMEFYRRRVAAYEDAKIAEMGDVYPEGLDRS